MEPLLQGLLNAHVDFDFGDELILEWMGEVESGAVRIGQMRYPIVVLPYLENMEDHTFALLGAIFAKGREGSDDRKCAYPYTRHSR